MTERLYYDDSYCTGFDAVIEEVDGERIRLDRSAFYPTSGGQPFDTGTLNGCAVTDVFVDDKLDVWHVCEGTWTVGQNVHGEIDWERRFDHMQQHAGEHMLANACWRLLGGMTIGLHLGHEASSIDVELPNGRTRISLEELRTLEDDVNARIQRDVPIRCWFPSEQELKELPLRKAPAVKEHIRIVQIGSEEYVACGGTHPSAAGQIGMVKVIDARPSKGKLRLTFLCGKRAYEHYRTLYDMSGAAAELLSTGRENLSDAVAKLQERLKTAENALQNFRRDSLLKNAESMLAAAEKMENGDRLVIVKVEADMPLLRDLASELTASGDIVALLSAPTESGNLVVFARGVGAKTDVGRLLSSAARAAGGKGGGKADFAQGNLTDAGLEEAYRSVRKDGGR